MSTLDKIEREHRKLVLKRVHLFSEISFTRFLFIGFIATPFILAEALFVPILGQLLFLLAFCLTLFYLFRSRSFKAFFALLLGILCSLVITSLVAKKVSENGPLIFYFIVGFCTLFTFAYICWIAGEISALYKRADESS